MHFIFVYSATAVLLPSMQPPAPYSLSTSKASNVGTPTASFTRSFKRVPAGSAVESRWMWHRPTLSLCATDVHAAAPDDETVRHWDEPVSVQEATAYKYTPQPLYRHDEGTPPRRGPSSDRGSSMAPSTTTELLEQFTDTMDEAVERTMVGFYRSLSPSTALNDAMA